MVLPGGEVHPYFAAAIGDLAECASVIGPLDLVAAGVPAGLPDAGRQAGVLAPELAGPRRAPVFMTAVRAAVQEEDHAAAAAVHAGQGTSRQARGLRAKILQAGRGCGTRRSVSWRFIARSASAAWSRAPGRRQADMGGHCQAPEAAGRGGHRPGR
jgi:hypothetical protein